MPRAGRRNAIAELGPMTPDSSSRWSRAYAAVPERAPSFTTLSGERVEPLYTAADAPNAERHRAAGRVSVHARRVPEHVPRPAVDDAPVAVDTLDDMEDLFRGIDLGDVTVSMTINAPAAIMMAFYVVAAERQGVPADRLGGTIQADILKEYIAQKEWCFPIDPAMRLLGDMIASCSADMPRWHPVSISGYRGSRARRAADPADHRPRDGSGEHHRSPRRLLLRRGADRSHRGGCVRLLPPHRRARRDG